MPSLFRVRVGASVYFTIMVVLAYPHSQTCGECEGVAVGYGEPFDALIPARMRIRSISHGRAHGCTVKPSSQSDARSCVLLRNA